MKKLSKSGLLALFVSAVLVMNQAAFAQEAELPEAGLTPDSLFYFVEIIVEEIGTFFTFGDLKKAERYAALAAERVAEAKDMVEKGKLKFVEKPLKRYETQLNKSMIRAEKAMFEGKDFEKVMEAIARAGKTTSVHLGVLTEVYEKVPEQAKTAVENAMKVSVKRHEKAVEALKASNHLGEVPEEVPISTKVPQEVRERIQRKAQEELMVEKALQISESSRDLCIKAGGPSEMCEKIPLKGFKSLEALKAFFIEAGAPAEAWATAESKCKELGAAKPDECFRILLFSTTAAYGSVGPTARPATILSEEEIEARRRGEEEQRRIQE